jgi:UDP-N-acetylmuramoylalanine--D-glutamate ligase
MFLAEEGEFLAATGVKWEAGDHSLGFLSQVELLLVSPGVSLQLPLLMTLQRNGVRVAGEFAVAAGLFDVPVVAVTGTNGKTTVTTLIGEILVGTGKRVFVGGNIGTPLYEYLLNPGEYDIVVAEVSSFQLETAGDFSPDVGLLLNITPDHLDRHGTMGKYVQAKMQLFAHQRPGTVAILNGDDPVCQNLPKGGAPTVYTFGRNDRSTAVVKEQRISVALNDAQEEYLFNGSPGAGSGITLMNYAAAILAARSQGCTPEQIQSVLDGFQSLPHRIEFVAEIDGVSYYNDSKATNSGAVIGALAQFGGNVILLAGGRDKGDDFRLLRESVVAKVKQMVVLGEAAQLLRDCLADVVDIRSAQSMADAVNTAAKDAIAGDVVLLSPACASFDMFTSYGHRGNEFKKAVIALQTIKE